MKEQVKSKVVNVGIGKWKLEIGLGGGTHKTKLVV